MYEFYVSKNTSRRKRERKKKEHITGNNNPRMNESHIKHNSLQHFSHIVWIIIIIIIKLMLNTWCTTLTNTTKRNLHIPKLN